MMTPQQIRDLMDELIKNPDATVQSRFLCGEDSRWTDIRGESSWDFYYYEYRIKPKPREPRAIYVNEYKDGSFGNVWQSEKGARSFTEGAVRTAVKFIEVIED